MLLYHNFLRFHKGRNLNKMGLKGHDTAELFFEDVRLPKSAILGNVDSFLN
jgi:alkylation response protein AidB-like acyl-CoA dehydrogenase